MQGAHVQLVVNARAAHAVSDAEDLASVPGVWCVLVDPDVPRELLATAALDIFHTRVPVSELDPWEFDVVETGTGKVLGEPDMDEAPGRYADAGSVEGRLDEQALVVASVRVRGVTGEGEGADCGSILLAAPSIDRVQELAIKALWDERLARSGLTPVAEVESISADVMRDAPAPARQRPRS